MQPFEYIEASSVQDAVALLAGQPDDARLIAGGTDLLSEIKEGVVTPRRLVGLAGVSDLQGISEDADGLTIGAMTTIAEVAIHPTIRANYTALAQASGGLATPQIRNVGTLGGNLNQRPRCWYYRHPLTRCLKKGGDRCYALAGNTKYLCVTGGDRCYIVHPSDTAVALAALDARIEVAGPHGRRELPIGSFFVGPGQNLGRENILEPDELVTRVRLPKPAPDQRSLYLKAREREAGDFALVSVAIALTLAGGVIRRVSVVLGGVAPVPYQAGSVEGYLLDRHISQVDPVHAGSLALPDARPMADNAYKVPLARNLVKRAIRQLLTVRADSE